MGILQEPSSLGASLSSCRDQALGPTPSLPRRSLSPRDNISGGWFWVWSVMPGVVSYAKGGVRQRSRESRPACAGEEGEGSPDPRLLTSVRCAPARKEGTRGKPRS